MSAWATSHPYLTTFMFVILCVTLHDAISNICSAFTPYEEEKDKEEEDDQHTN